MENKIHSSRHFITNYISKHANILNGIEMKKPLLEKSICILGRTFFMCFDV